MKAVEAIMDRGVLIMDEAHADGGLGVRVTGLPNGSIAILARTEFLSVEAGRGTAFFVIGPKGTEHMRDALVLWHDTLAPKVEEPPPQALEPPDDE